MADKIDADAAKPITQPTISSILNDFVHKHQMSSQRDAADAENDRTFPPTDKAARATIQAAVDVDNQILALARAGKPIPQSLIDSATRTHAATSADAQRDRSGDNDAMRDDKSNVGAEQLVINSDQRLLRHANITPEVRRMLEQDIASKQRLIANDQQDFGIEAGYVKHDIAELAANDRLAKALKGNRADLIPALEASLAAKINIALDRGDDMVREPRYAHADDQDQKINEMLLDALRDPCVWASLHAKKHN